MCLLYFCLTQILTCGNKTPTRCNRWFLLQILLSSATARRPDTQPSAPHHTDNLKTKASNTTGSSHLYNTLELLMMGIMVPETCWASNKICNKNLLLHLVGISFPHIKDMATFWGHHSLCSLFVTVSASHNTQHITKFFPISCWATWLYRILHISYSLQPPTTLFWKC